MLSLEEKKVECRDYLIYLTVTRAVLQLGLSFARISDGCPGNKQTKRKGDFNFRKNENVNKKINVVNNTLFGSVLNCIYRVPEMYTL